MDFVPRHVELLAIGHERHFLREEVQRRVRNVYIQYLKIINLIIIICFSFNAIIEHLLIFLYFIFLYVEKHDFEKWW